MRSNPTVTNRPPEVRTYGIPEIPSGGELVNRENQNSSLTVIENPNLEAGKLGILVARHTLYRDPDFVRLRTVTHLRVGQNSKDAEFDTLDEVKVSRKEPPYFVAKKKNDQVLPARSEIPYDICPISS